MPVVPVAPVPGAPAVPGPWQQQSLVYRATGPPAGYLQGQARTAQIQTLPEEGCVGSCSGGAEDACFEAEGNVRDVSWQYVGEGRGGYAKVNNFNYVGEGVGSYDATVMGGERSGSGSGRCNVLQCQLVLLGLLVAVAVAAGVYTAVGLQLAPPAPATSRLGRPARPAAGPAASIVAHDSENEHLVELFNCQRDGLMIPAKVRYCCQKHKLFCDRQASESEGAGAPPIAEAPSRGGAASAVGAVGLFDCDERGDEWKTSWAVPQKIWCCQNQGRGCEFQLRAGAPAGRRI